MIQAQNIQKSYGANIILSDIRFSITADDRIGLIGPNGSGKSTLLRILAKEEKPDTGSIIYANNLSVGFIPQGSVYKTGQTVDQFLWSANPMLTQVRHKISAIEDKMALGDSSEEIIHKYGETLETFERLGGYEMDHRIQKVIVGLGLNHIEKSKLCSTMSGGEFRRLCLTSLLITEPDILLLDEPTNHLDLSALNWLEQFLLHYPGAILVVSHDRTFLDNTVNRILELDEHNHQLNEYSGNYSTYEVIKQNQIDKTWQVWYDQRAEIRRIKQDIQITRQQALGVEQKTKNDFKRGIAKKVAKKARSREKKLERYIDSSGFIERPPKAEKIKLELNGTIRSGEDVIRLEQISHRFGDQWLFEDINTSIHYGDRIALTGKNGSGKSTLLKIIIAKLQPYCGIVTKGAGVHFGYLSQHHDNLPGEKTPYDIIKSVKAMPDEEVFNYLHKYLIIGDKVHQPITFLSFGELTRLYLAEMVLSGANFLVLDEPINHLDIPSRKQFEQALNDFPGTILMSIHDRSFINHFARRVWILDKKHLVER